MTETFQIESSRVNGDAIHRAAELIRAGGLVAFPTETVYGLGANALDPAAVGRIFAAKGRPPNNPIIVHVAAIEDAHKLTADWPPTAQRLAERFWPGPLTLVLPKRQCVPEIVTAGAATVGIRVPAHPIARALVEAAGLPIAAPSANRSNEISPTTAEHVQKSVGAAVDVILDGGPTPGGLESTVLDLTKAPPRLLRPGLVSPGEIEAVIGPIERGKTVAPDLTAPLSSPGQLPRHYAPRAPMECLASGGRSRVERLAAEGIQVGWLALGGNQRPIPGATMIAMPSSAVDYATQLYAALHRLDDLGVERIVVDLPPDDANWLAVRDRLKRGSIEWVSGGT
ncbi:MAG TPA: L-threonylcarbamoyladenylate synthase [Pirellulales bacterium]|nr:L-threonylcarbamoyladenylate synthase [Pirellulales bacterium]